MTTTKDYPIILADPDERAAERDADPDWADYFLTDVEQGKDGWVYITVGEALKTGMKYAMGHWTCGVRWGDFPYVAAKGMKVRAWNHGSETVGLSVWIGGELQPVYYKTKREREAEHGAWLADWQRQQHEEFERDKAKLDAAYEALPGPLKRRIDRFRAKDPNFRWKEEAYEMIACAEAGRLYRAAMDPATGVILKDAGIKVANDPKLRDYEQPKGEGTTDWEDTPENRLVAIDAINGPPNNYDYPLLERLFPWIDKGHSGNTWGHAMLFARVLVRDGEGAQL